MTKTSERLTLFAQFACIAVAVVVLTSVAFGALVSPKDVKGATSPSRAETQIDQLLNGGSLEVRDAVGDPKPLNSNLQSPQGTSEQKARGSLQQPGAGLQPNAGLSEFLSE